MPHEPDKNDTPEQEPNPSPADKGAPRRGRRAKPAAADTIDAESQAQPGQEGEPAAESPVTGGGAPAESPAAELEAAEAAPMEPLLPDDELEEEPAYIEVHETVTVSSLPLSAMELLRVGVEAMAARQRRGGLAPTLQRQVRKAAAVAGGVVQAAEVDPAILDEYGLALTRLAVLLGTDPGRRKPRHRALAAFIRQERKTLEGALD